MHRIRLQAGLLLLSLLPGPAPAAAPPASRRTDRQGDPLPRWAIARLGTVRLRHGVSLGSGHGNLIFSGDGRTLLSRSDDGLAVWDVESGRRLLWKSGRDWKATRLLANGKTLVTAIARKGGWVVERSSWGRPDDRETVELQSPPQDAFRMAYLSPDGKLLATWKFSGQLLLHDTVTGRLRGRIPLQGLVEAMLDVTPDGKRLILCTRDGLRVYDTATLTETNELPGKELKSTYSFPQVSPDGKRLVLWGRSRLSFGLSLWDLKTGKRLALREGVRGPLDFTSDGKGLACLDDQAVVLLDAETLKVVRRFAPHRESRMVSAVAFSCDGKKLALGTAHAIGLFDVATGKALPQPAGHFSMVTSLAFSADGRRLASGGGDGVAHVWDLATSRSLHALEGHQFAVQGLAFAPDGKLLATGDGVWGASRGASTLRLFDLGAGKLVRQFESHLNWTSTLLFSDDGKRLATGGGDARVRLWDVASGRRLGQVRHLPQSRPLAFLEGGKSLFIHERGPCRVIETASLKTLRSFGRRSNGIATATVCRPGERQAIVVNDGQVVWYDLPSGKDERGFMLMDYPRTGEAALAPDGSLLAGAVSFRGDIGLWDLATGKRFATLTGHSGYVNVLAFSPDGRLLASGNHDTTVLVWDVERVWVEHTLDELLDGNANRVQRQFPRRGIAILSERLHRAAVSEKRARKLIVDLDSDTFAVRQKASEELEKLGADAAFALKQALESSTSPEVRLRCLRILDRLSKKALDESISPARVRQAVALLVKLGTPEARKALDELARLDAATLVGREARQALKKMKPTQPKR
jgi:WD40 repeat protein